MSEIIVILLRTVVVFIIILTFFRFMGKKELGELSLLDIIVSLMIAELAVIAIEDPEVSMARGLAPIFLLILIQVTLTTISLKNQKFRDLIEGRPVMIIENGKINQTNMRKQRYNIDDVLFQLREKGVSDIRQVDFAILERSGNLSIFRKEDNSSVFTLPLIQDGVIQDDHLKVINRTKEWLLSELAQKGYDHIRDIFYCSYMNGHFFIEERDKRSIKSRM
ncbi:DUF421 domain-containing protein [Alkalihalobacillus sp. MEB130]|uniref:DUF421 domain-containing protein n=1 Tax=Alkalihalobacillus sp. MEB130 TaxID=2976704 RepID=UPI0028DEAA48|nr:DUF421 domain-containing protein [Alkalihalobacillus sp. MEB130]MDT8862669.1 DUF421 domain-containing protein [Alkalihalobacillus sp. MEB130]